MYCIFGNPFYTQTCYLFYWPRSFFFFIYLFILLYNIVLVLPYIDMNLPWVYMCSPSWTPLPLPSPSHPSGSFQCTSPKHPVSCIEPRLDWRFVSHMIIYMFQCHSTISSHPRPLPQSPKACSLHLCLFCCLAYKVIVTIFLNGIEFLILTSVATCGSWLLGWTLWVWQSSEEQSFLALDGRSQTQTWAGGPCRFPRGQLRVCLLSQLSIY